MAGTQTVTILFTDMVGSTELASRIGDDAADHVRRRHLNSLRQAVTRFDGREVKGVGDGLMVSFSSAAGALDAAVAMQQATEAQRATGDGCPSIRIGMSAGDASYEDGDWYGVPVVEAARLCAAAPAEHIYVADILRALTAGRARHRFDELEPLALKGLPDPVRACDLLWEPAPASPNPRIAVADDSVLLREGVVRVLTANGCDVIAEAGDADSLLAMIENDPPDVVVLDIRMPPTHTDEGIRAALEIRARYEDVGVLVLSQYLETAYALRLLDESATRVGYLLKDRVSDVDQFVDAIRRVAAGESVIDPEIVSKLVSRRRERDPLEGLSERERDVLELMAEGRSNQAIAERLFLSPKTVETHVRGIFTKLGILEDASDNRRVRAVLTYLRQAP